MVSGCFIRELRSKIHSYLAAGAVEMERPMEGQDVKTAVAVIDNGKFGKREIRFETGRLAKQAAGAAAVYLDDETMIFSATTASSHQKINSISFL